ncbi:Calx-beta domain-containing protein [Geobacter sulfurreducens]|uniref:Calx-beta domain-containing protein n=1 Tax=Geobacter sulfurreducens TaxID=35554 RepID=UPI0020B8019F|nr:Calx-beta domain-containing protein [Geobacter sulfurreducens]UTG92986.1 cadherin domain-containing protein [Geobacter sulfurreducens]
MKKTSDDQVRAAKGKSIPLSSSGKDFIEGSLDFRPVSPKKQTAVRKPGEEQEEKAAVAAEQTESDHMTADEAADVSYDHVAAITGEQSFADTLSVADQTKTGKEEKCGDNNDDDDCDDKGGWLWWAGGAVGVAGGSIGFAVAALNGDDDEGTHVDTAAVAFAGRVTDGPVHGATIYNDINKNGVYDDGIDKAMTHNSEAITSDADGNFTITVGDLIENGITDINKLKLVAYGGIDTVTGEAVTVDFTAPEGYRYLNPVTSLIAAYMEAYNEANPNAKITAAEAEEAVIQALGLPQIDYATTDLALPETAVEAQKVAAILAVAAMLIEESGTDSDGFAFLAAHLAPSETPLPGTMTYLTDEVTTALQSANDTTAANQFSSTVVAVNDATSLDDINTALNNTIFADLIVAGNVKVGQTLDGGLGMGSTTGLEVTYQWLESIDGTTWTPIAGETGSDYTIRPTDILHHLRLQATYIGTDGQPRTIFYDVGVVPDSSPVFASSTSGAVAENEAVGTVVYRAEATSDLENNPLSYSLGGTDADLFTIDVATGEVTLKNPADYESKSSYSIDITATDTYGLTSTTSVTIGIDNLDEVAPSITSGPTAATIAENSGPGQVVYTAAADDSADISGGVTFSLKADGDAALFTIDAATGEVTLTGNPDYEAKPAYSFTVVAADAAGHSTEQTVTLAIDNLDEVAPSITSGPTAAAIAENSGSGQVVYTAAADDSADISGGVTFSLKADGDAALFTIDAATGEVTLTGNPDYEAKPAYSFTVVATDAAGHSTEQTVTLAIDNLDEVAPSITSGPTAAAIEENSGPGQVVYTAAADDSADISGGVTFSLKADGDAALFTIDAATGEVTLTGNPDYEAKPAYSFTVVATDAAGHSTEQTVTLAIDNLDEVAPSITSGPTADIAENTGAGQVIYTAVADDAADISGGVTWSLKAGSDAALTIDAVTGAVTLADNPDHEAKSGYSFTVVATDAAGYSTEQAVELSVLDNNASAAIAVDLTTIAEGSEGTSTILTYTVTRTSALNASSVDWAISGVDAADLAAGQAAVGTVTFAIGETSKTFTVEVVGDRTIESNEDLVVTLGNPGNDIDLGTADSSATTIADDDGEVSIAATAVSVPEGDTGDSRVVTFTVTRTNTLSASSVDWDVAGGTVNAADFGGTLPSGTVTFAEGEATKTISITVTGDRIIEPDETLTVRLSNPGLNLVLGVDEASSTIVNDDVGFSIFGDVMDVVEGGIGEQRAITFHVVRSDSLTLPMTIDYRLIPRGSTVPDGFDFTGSPDSLGDNAGRPSGTISFGPDETSKTVTIYVAGDAVPELNETFSIVLANAPPSTIIINGEIEGVIRSDETQYSIHAVTAATVEGNGTGGIQQFLITRTGDTSQPGSVGYTLSEYGENPTEANDFAAGTPLTGTISFAAGETSKILSVNLEGDSVLEGYESFQVALHTLDSNSIIGTNTAVASIIPDDAAINIAATDSIVKEGTGAVSRSHTFTLTRSSHVDSEVTVDWHLAGTGANPVDAADFGGTLPSGSVTFAPGETVKTLTITPSTDAAYEPHESYEIVLSTSQLGVVLETDHASGMILNDDSGLTLVATNLDKAEGNPGTPSQLTFTVQRTGDTTGESTVHWELVSADGSGVSAADFASGILPSGDLTFSRGVTSRVVTIPLTTDNIIEPDKGFTIRLSSPSEGTELLVSEVGGYIRNDDAAFTLESVSPVAEGHNGTTTVTFTVVRTGDISGADTVEYVVAPADGGAVVDGADFVGGQLPDGLITFNAGEASKTVTLAVAGDNALESDEAFTITLVNPGVGSTIASGSTDVVILNDDDALSIVATDADQAEAAAGGTRDFTFTVNRTGFLDRATTVNWSVAGVGANQVDAADFGGALPSGTLEFAANESSKTITITVNGDYFQEADEGFRVTLSSPSDGTTLTTASADGVIRNDDTGLAITATTTTLAEGDSGTVTHVFTVTRTGVTTGTTTVDWALAGSGGHPVDAADFGGTLPSGTLVFAPGETTKTIEVQASGDTDIEPGEGFTITLSGADGNADIMTASANGTVVADDISIAISAGTASVMEGATGSSRVLQFTVTRTGDLASPVSIDWSASGMDAADFANGTALSGTINFGAGETVKTINLTQIGDNVSESDETLTITLSNPAGNPAHDRTYITSATATTDVVNDDASLTITADAASQNEHNTGDGEATSFTFTVTRTGDTSTETTIDWVLQLPGGAGSAAGNDFVAGQDLLGTNSGLPSGTISFAADETSKTITVLVATDNQVEQDETFSIQLQGAGANTEVSGNSASAVISNDDTGFSIIALAADHTEANGGTVTYTFRVTRAGDISSAATVDWDVAGSGASPANADDFGGSLPGGTLSFAENEASKEISFTVSGDTVVEQDEEFTVTISNAQLTDATPQLIQDATVGGIIRNDDQSFSVSAANASVTEGSAGTTQIAYTITRTGDLSDSVTIDYAVTGAGGAATSDVQGGVLPTGTLTFAAGETSKSVTFDVIADTLAEGNETFTLTLTNPSAGIIGTASDSTVVVNDDTNFTLSAPAPFAEGESGSATATFTVTRSGDSTGAGSVQWSVAPATGLTTADFTGNQDLLGTNSGLPSGTITFAAGETSKNITIQVAGDLTLENDETLRVILADPTGGTIEGTDGDKSTTILTDDDSFSISTLTASRAEGNSDSTITYTVTRTGSLVGARDLTWTITGADGFATGNDLAGGQAATGTVSFADGQESATIVVNVKGDSAVESDETMTVTLSGAPANSVIGTASASTVLTNDDASVSIVTLIADKNEGNVTIVTPTGEVPGSTASTFTVSAAGTVSGTVESAGDRDWYKVNLVAGHQYQIDLIGNGSYTAGDVFLSLRNSTGIQLASNDDFIGVNSRITYTAPSNGIYFIDAGHLGSGTGTYGVTIADLTVPGTDMSAPAYGVGAQPYTFTITRTGDTTHGSTVEWRVAQGVGVDAVDFGSVGSQDLLGDNSGLPSGTVTFAAGEISKTLTVNIATDSAKETDEILRVVLSNPSAGTEVITASADGIVRNDDAELNITAGTFNLLEGDGLHGTGKAMTYTVTRTGNINQTSTVDWSVVHGTTSSADFTNGVGSNLTPSGTLTFASGVATQTIVVYVYGDTGVGSVEGDETFSIQLSNPNSGSALGNITSYTSTILEDDTRLVLSAADYSQAEKTAGNNTTYTYNIAREGYTGGTTNYSWAVGYTDPYTGNPAYMYDNTQSRYETVTANASDFTGSLSGSGSFSAGQTNASFTVTVTGDDTPEDDEWFAVNLTASSGYDEVTVIYDDPTKGTGTQLARTYYSPYRTYYDGQQVSSATNGVASNTNYLFSSIERDEAVYYLSDREVASTSVQTLNPGDGLRTRVEGDTPADGGAGATTVTIEGVEYGYVEHIFAVQRQVATAGTASVGWRIGTYYNAAVSADDFLTITRDGNGDITAITTAGALPSGTVTFADGQEWAYIKFYTKVDDIGEYDEYFSIFLENPSAGSSIYTYDTVSYPQYNYGIITNDDTRFDASVNDVVEGGTLTYTVTRSGDSRGTDTVDWSLALPGSEATNESNNSTGTWYKLDPSDIDSVTPSNGTATYNAGTLTWSGTLTFEDGETTKTITVVTTDDSWTETWREELPIVLSNATNVNAGEGNHDQETASTGYTDTARVYDNESDPLIGVSVGSSTTWEGTGANDSATGNSVTFTITRTDQGGRDGSLNYPTTVAWRLDGSGINWGSANNSAEILTYGGDAASVNEYTSNTTYGVVTFAAGETSKNVVVTFTGDRYVESDKTLTFTVLDPDDAEHGPLYTDFYGPADINNAQASVTTTLKNDDIRLWVGGWDTYSGDANGYYTNVQTSAYEGNPLTFAVNRYGRLDCDIVVNYTLINGTTTNGDFTTTSGSFTLAAQGSAYGEYTYSISLADLLTDDTTVEANETFTLRLSAPGDSAGSSVRFQSYYADYTSSYNSPATTLDVRGTVYDDDTTYTLTPASTSLVETDQGASQTFSFDVTRGGTGYTGAAQLRWRVEAVGGTPADSADFTSTDLLGTNNGLPSGTVSFANGELTKTFSVLIRGDLVAENNETFRVVLYEDVLTSSSPTITNSQSVASSTLTIVTDDTGISIADSTLTESDANQTMTFTITRSGDTSGTSSMNWTLYHGTTTAGDFSGATTGTVSFAAGETSKTISVTVAGDATPEADETFTILLSNLVGVDEAIDISATGTIKNDDSSFAIAGDAASSPESGSQTFTITRTNDTAQSQTITWSVSAGSAGAADFGGSLPSGSVTFAPGEMSKTITISPSSDATPETDESYTVSIALGAGTTGDTITQATATGTIENDDAAIYIAADQTNQQEGHSGTTPFTFTVTRTGNTTGAASVDWALSSAGASAADFTTADGLGSNGGLPSGTITFADGESAKTITIEIVGDEVVEADESFTITLSNAAGGAIITGSAGSTIANDDSTIAIAADSAVKNEGNSGTTAYTFTITRTGYLGEAETVEYSVAGSGAHPADGTDFNGTTGTLTLAAGEATTTLTINVSGDLSGEPDEDFTVTLSNPSSGVTITTDTATGSILADDIVFDVAAPASQTEGNPGDTTYFDFVVTRSGNLSGSQTLTWSVAGIGADGTSGSDFDSTTGTVTFDPGETSKTISVPVKGDYLGEADENFRLTLTGPDGVVFTHNSADATIIDDEASLRISATDAGRAEGANGVTSYTFTVTRTGNTALEATVDWSLAAGATDPDDFAGGTLPSGSLSFAAGELSKTITVDVAGDTAIEGDESFTVSLSNASTGADIVIGSATGTIVSDDVEWTVSPLSVPAVEGDGASSYVFRVTRTGSLSATTLDWSTAGSGTNPADADDFLGSFFPSGTLVFAQGQTSQDIVVQIAGDNLLEADKEFSVTLAAPVNGLTHSYAEQTASATIVNDDDVISIAPLSADHAEGTDSSSPFTFTVTRTGSLTGTSTVGWRIVHGDTSADDFVATTGTVSFADGQDTATLTVLVSGDRNLEGDEGFSVELYNPGAGSTVDDTATTASGIIHDDDVDLSLAAADANVAEGDSSTAGHATFTVTRSGDLSVETSVNWNVVAGTATAADFAGGELPGGTVVFGAGESSKTITIDLAGDGAWEGNETYTVQLSGARDHADIVANNVSGQIIDDDDTLTLSAVSADHAEGNSGATIYTFRIDRAGTATGATSVEWIAAGSGAHPTDQDDLLATTGTVTFADGETSKTFTVEVAGDTTGEYDETFSVSLANPAYGSTTVGAPVTATVRNDDAVLFVRADHVSVAEGADGVETTFTFTVTRSGDTSGAASALWEVTGSGLRPANAADFGGIFPSGAVAFQPGESTQQISLTVLGDAVGEYDETFSLVLSDPEGATILEGTAETIIANDDTGISITALDADKAEGNNGLTDFTFRIERVGLANGAASVSWAVAGTGSYPAGADDFAGGILPSGTVYFADGESVKDITIQVAGDETYGQDQTFRVLLSNPAGANLINADATGVIRNDDSQVAITALDTAKLEGNAGTTTFSFQVTRTGALDTSATIDWDVIGSGGHQTVAGDFAGNSFPGGALTFAVGESSKTITVEVAGDTLTEVDEEFSVRLRNPGSGVSIAPNAGEASATILSDDDGVVLIGLDVDRHEGASGTQTVYTYQVLRSGNIDAPITLNYAVSGDVDSADFMSPLTGSFEMGAGENSRLLTLTVNGDDIVEPDEFFQVTLSGSGINIDSTPVTGAIRGDDVAGDGNDVIHAAATADTINSGAGDDVIHLTMDNLLHLQVTDGAHVDGGLGFDTILFDAAGQEFDLVALVANDAMSGIEKIDLGGEGNTLRLTTAELLHQDQNLFSILANGSEPFHQLMVDGDADDEVIIADITNWSHGAADTYTDGSVTYDVYTNGTDHTQLLINQAITNVHGVAG